MNDKVERLKYLREELGLNKPKFAELLGVSQQYVSQIEGRVSDRWPKNEKLTKLIKELYGKFTPAVTLGWILRGEGEIPQRTEPENIKDVAPSTKGTIFPSLQKHGEKFAYQKDKLQILTVSVDLSTNEEWVDVVPEFALGGYAEGYADRNFFRDLPKETIPEDLRGRGTIRKFQVYGESMEPTVNHFDWVYCSYMQITSVQEFLSKFRNGFMYVLNTVSRGVIIKRVYYKDGDQYLICESDNPDQKTYAPFAVDINDVREFWYWRRTYTAKGSRPARVAEELTTLKYDMMRTQHQISTLEKSVSEIGTNINLIAKSLPGNINLD